VHKGFSRLLFALAALAFAANSPVLAQAAGGITLVPADSGNEARFRVREQLVRLAFPSDAVGRTSDVSGAVVLGPAGDIDSVQSRFTVDLRTLVSDNARRDGYIRRNTLRTDSFPTITFVPSSAPGLTWPLPATGNVTFDLVGRLTVHGVTKPSTWKVFAQLGADSAITGSASTRFTFGEFGMPIPRVGMVLSVEDDIRLEYEFRLVRQ
jgi:polyisoprenoid-binding protein YceI